ncbi:MULTISPECIES: hypothetical protein [unclassified Flavobacterium]|jgi:hypothetical protein|uniref:hypothetical protein n=1 Tax=unclassified Flavobacterium TaxID=196869 RepID=UPI00070C7F1A|nr:MULTISPECIES: hypothetical protein [unclassified Flavobacterium]KRD61764.1 hypothetical protein ASE40_09585 [Flavobacterium sp. Root935]MDQ1167000.1 hypothetical protein [Flavobacterium sp. SORGH_AS_0622]TDX12356.1 hypothetical protein EDB96_1417 [Flavobacterium sp. S87F.05.LMB.W.Kidney.N]BDU27462.1 hypothetical protein FLGSB24_42060 [Flavobacterium sp. GSB-24]
MSLTIFRDKIRFHYKSKNWQYQFDEIKEIGLLKKKKKYFLENSVFIAVTAVTYYCMIFSDIIDVYYIIPAVLCYSLVIIAWFREKTEFNYFVFVKDVYKNKIRTKIKAEDRVLISRQIDHFLDLQFERSIGRTA